jgi:hypothetical protein
MEVENPEELKLYNVTEKDEGWYTCIAQNTLGETFSSAYLRVVESESYPSSFIRESLQFHGFAFLNVATSKFVNVITT